MNEFSLNWYELNENNYVNLKENLLIELIDKSIVKAGNIFRLSKQLNLSDPTFYYVKKGKIKQISIRKLKKLMNYLELEYEYINDKIIEIRKGNIASIKNPKFPFKLDTNDGAFLIGCLVSDGTLYQERKNIQRIKYSSNDEESINTFINKIQNIFGEVYFQKECKRGNTYLKIGNSIIPQAFIKVGIKIGNKTKLNSNLPRVIFRDKELTINYLKAAFSDEGSVGGGNGKGYNPYLILNRSCWIDNLLNLNMKKHIEKKLVPLMKIKQFPTGHKNQFINFKKAKEILGNEFWINIEQNGLPKFLQDESLLLSKLNIKNRLWIRGISKTQNGHYSLACDLFISNKQGLLKFYKEVGFSLSRKQDKLKKALEEVGWLDKFNVV